MTFPEHPPDTARSTEVSLDELQRSLRTLRAMFNVVLVILLVLTGSLFLFLLREVSQIRRQTRELTQFVDNYEKTSLPAMLEFRNKLQEFAKGHPDFRAILAKYMNPTNTPPGRPQEADDGSARMPVMPVK
jgi:predicted PurR-regulated permease PerM